MTKITYSPVGCLYVPPDGRLISWVNDIFRNYVQKVFDMDHAGAGFQEDFSMVLYSIYTLTDQSGMGKNSSLLGLALVVYNLTLALFDRLLRSHDVDSDSPHQGAFQPSTRIVRPHWLRGVKEYRDLEPMRTIAGTG